VRRTGPDGRLDRRCASRGRLDRRWSLRPQKKRSLAGTCRACAGPAHARPRAPHAGPRACTLAFAPRALALAPMSKDGSGRSARMDRPETCPAPWGGATFARNPGCDGGWSAINRPGSGFPRLCPLETPRRRKLHAACMKCTATIGMLPGYWVVAEINRARCPAESAYDRGEQTGRDGLSRNQHHPP
jgi:hypothetical protein